MIIAGENVDLREMSLEDTENIINWRNNPRVKKMFCIQSDFTEEGHINWYNNMILKGFVKQFIIVDKKAKKDVGSIYLRDIDYKNKKAEYGIFIGEDSCRGKGIGSEAGKLLVKYAFEELKLHKIFLRVFEDNEVAINSYKNIGFTIEGIFKDDICLGKGDYKSLIFMAIINNEEEEVKK